eukprot:gi/632936124/ref/XP_007892507.1/ PREDICTED: uncharacterized protein LOC103179179 isoform X2 [Callorhinchus milii]
MDQCGEGVRLSCSARDGLPTPVTTANRTSIGDGRQDVQVRDLLELPRTGFTKLFLYSNSLTSLQPPIPVYGAIAKRRRFSSASFSLVCVGPVLDSASGSVRGPEWLRGDGPLGTEGRAGGHGCGATPQSDAVIVKRSPIAAESQQCCSAEASESRRLPPGPREAQPGAAGGEAAEGEHCSIHSEMEKANRLALTLALEELRNRFRKLNEKYSALFGSPESGVGGRKGSACGSASPAAVPKRESASPAAVPKRESASPAAVPKRESASPAAVPKRMVHKAISCDLSPVAPELTDGNSSPALPITIPGWTPTELSLAVTVTAGPPAEDETSLLLEAKVFPQSLGLSTLTSPPSPLHPAIKPLAERISLNCPFFTSLSAEECMTIVGGLTVQREEASKSPVTVPSPGHVRLCSYIDNETLPTCSFMEPEEVDLKPLLQLTDPKAESHPPELSGDSGLADRDLTVVCSLPCFKLDIENVIQLNETKPLSSGQGPVHEKVLECPGQTRSEGEPSPGRASDPAPGRVGDLTHSVEQREEARGVGAVEWELSLHQGLDFFESEGNLLHNDLEWFPCRASTPLLRTKAGSLGTCSFSSRFHTSSSDLMMILMGNATEASAAKERVCGGSSTAVLETKSGDKAASEPEASQQLKVETVDVSNPVANHSGARRKMPPFPVKPVGQTSTLALSRPARALVGTGIPLKKNHGLPKPRVSSANALGCKANNSGGAEMRRSVADPPRAATQRPPARDAGKGMRSRLSQPLPALPVLQETKGLEVKPAEQQLKLFAGPRTRRNTREEEVRPNPRWRGGGRRCPLGPCEPKSNRLPHKAALGQVPSKTAWNLPGTRNWSSQRSQNGSNQQNNGAGAKPAGHGHLGIGDPAGSRSVQKAEGIASNMLATRKKRPSTTLLQGRLDSLPKRFKMAGEMPPGRRSSDVRLAAKAESLVGAKPKVKE